mmetsp:Transcript_11927/g.29379  ORF Transcript_11927/g.29379 Transcript_11927/m.29379 type:complete len:242 (+) Transcript_11927:468-1193(+)
MWCLLYIKVQKAVVLFCLDKFIDLNLGTEELVTPPLQMKLSTILGGTEERAEQIPEKIVVRDSRIMFPSFQNHCQTSVHALRHHRFECITRDLCFPITSLLIFSHLSGDTIVRPKVGIIIADDVQGWDFLAAPKTRGIFMGRKVAVFDIEGRNNPAVDKLAVSSIVVSSDRHCTFRGPGEEHTSSPNEYRQTIQYHPQLRSSGPEHFLIEIFIFHRVFKHRLRLCRVCMFSLSTRCVNKIL